MTNNLDLDILTLLIYQWPNTNDNNPDLDILTLLIYQWPNTIMTNNPNLDILTLLIETYYKEL